MGFAMASNLFASTVSTHKFVIHDQNAGSLERFVGTAGQNGVSTSSLSIAATPRDVAEQADVVFTMLPAGPHVRGVYEEVVKGLRKDVLCVDCSTIDVATAREVAAWVGEKGARMVDAPVSGGTGAATAGTLTFMVGAASERDVEAARPFLEKMGKNIYHCGLNGTGQAAKICNNMMLGICMVGASETFNLGRRLGLAPSLLNQILNTSSGRSWSTDTYNPVPHLNPNVPASKDYNGGFGVTLMAKDMGLAVTAATATHTPVPLGAAAEQIYKVVAATHGLEGKDFSVVYRWMGGEKEVKK
ncbi:mitochondrial 3-hydroxyisobutyrate dehydrogenase [Powellomyces hirtus]|nr:mitochondrial 3-hydroxyisobutyrate dehydrogenase [Powellomyces hirtus]